MTIPVLLKVVKSRYKTYRVSIAKSCIKRLRYKESSVAIRKRQKLYSHLARGFGHNVKIKAGVYIDYPEEIIIGSWVSIQHNCYLSAFGGLKIGNNVSLGAGVFIFTSHHPYDSGIIRNNPLEKRSVEIGDNVWVGAGAIILGGSVIGDNVVIGAGSVVTGELPSNGVYAGNPAQLIKSIDRR